MTCLIVQLLLLIVPIIMVRRGGSAGMWWFVFYIGIITGTAIYDEVGPAMVAWTFLGGLYAVLLYAIRKKDPSPKNEPEGLTLLQNKKRRERREWVVLIAVGLVCFTSCSVHFSRIGRAQKQMFDMMDELDKISAAVMESETGTPCTRGALLAYVDQAIPGLTQGQILDPWGKEWRLNVEEFTRTGDDQHCYVTLRCLGPDGQMDTDDDLMRSTGVTQWVSPSSE